MSGGTFILLFYIDLSRIQAFLAHVLQCFLDGLSEWRFTRLCACANKNGSIDVSSAQCKHWCRGARGRVMMMESTDLTIDAVTESLGIKELNMEQKRMIHSTVAGRNTFGILPTGFGKSYCFGIMSAVFDKVIWKLGL